MEPATYKFTAEEYQLMGKAGVFHPEARVELINGEIVVMSPIGLKHAVTLNRLLRYLFDHIKTDEGIISPQNSFRIPDYSEPEPDILVLKPRADFYAGKFPLSEDILLIIEIADSSLKYDRTTKLSLYAEQSIADYWIVNLEQNIVEIYRQPQDKSYLKSTLIDGPHIPFAPLAFPEMTMTLKDIYG